MSTIKLYDANAYTEEFESTVISCVTQDDGRIAVVLDATAFFPEAGGQSCDTGTIASIPVCDVQIDDNDIITHYLRLDNSSPGIPFSTGEKIRGKIDWIRRHTLMQHHSGEHLFSGLVFRDFGFSNVGFHLSDHICTMDYNGVLSDDDITRIEAECNEWIYRNTPISCNYPDEQTLDQLTYRCKGELRGPIRIVTIEGADVCACCAPHVHSTGEIGALKVLDAKSYKGGVRLEIICGRKAFADYRRRFELLKASSRQLSSKEDDLPRHIQLLCDEKYSLNGKILSLQEQLLSDKIEHMSTENGGVLLFTDNAEVKSIRNVINNWMSTHTQTCGIFCGDDNEGYQFIMGSSSCDMKDMAELLRSKAGAKCGGNSRMIQGSIQADHALIADIIYTR